MTQNIYIANANSQNIEVWQFYNHQNINLIQTIKTDGEVQPIAIIKEKKMLYAGVRPFNKIVTYHISDNGCLKKINESSIPGSPNYISFDASKKFLFCSSYHSNCISVSPLDDDSIPNNPIQIIKNVQGCHAAKINTKYNILFITALKEDSIYLYDFTQHGILKNTKQKSLKTVKKSGPRHIVFHPKKDFVYTVNELNGTIDTWEIQQTEKKELHIQNIQNVNIAPYLNAQCYWSSDIHMTSCGRFLYASDRHLNIISLFHVNAKNHKIYFFKSYPTEIQPRSFFINSENTYLIVSGEKSNKFSVYSISFVNGELNQLNTYNTGQRPVWILMY